MKKVINSIRKNPFLSIASAVLLGYIVFMLSRYSARAFLNWFDPMLKLDFYMKNIVVKVFILVYSILAILLINGGNLKGYGFNFSVNIKYTGLILKTFFITLASVIFGSILFMGILNRVFPTGNSAGFPEPKSLLEMILTVWVWSSLCEEILVRGLVQSFIQNWKQYKLLKLSVPVIVSGLFFGSMHLSLISAGMGAWFVTFTVFNTTIIGTMAAYYREKGESLIPAFWVHFIANFAGSIPLIIKILLT